MYPPHHLDVLETTGVVDTVTVYESIPILEIPVCFVYLCQRNRVYHDTTLSYHQLRTPASESPIPLVKLEMVVPDIVPEIISFAIFTVTVPEWKVCRRC